MAQDDRLGPPDTANREAATVQLDEAELDTRQLRGFKLWKMALKDAELTIKVSEVTTIWRSTTDRTRAYQVTREERNRRGSLVLEYRCQCPDYLKNGRIDCLHIFAERLRRLEVGVEEAQPYTPRARASAAEPRISKRRRNARGSLKSLQRRARVKMPSRIPELIASLKRASLDFFEPDAVRSSSATHADLYTRAAALLLKVASGKSADEMISAYEQFIDRGLLQLRRPPHQNTLSRWGNDANITPVLEHMLETTALPFRRVETAAIIDSSKLSQMRTAHSRLVEYGKDERESADWMKAHLAVGLESMICMSARFSGSIGDRVPRSGVRVTLDAGWALSR